METRNWKTATIPAHSEAWPLEETVANRKPIARLLKLQVSRSTPTKGSAGHIFGGSIPLNAVSRMACEVARYFLGAPPAVVIYDGLCMGWRYYSAGYSIAHFTARGCLLEMRRSEPSTLELKT
jgi:hypothetical protein